jgi:ornithine cyclodeaminase/alanine dehydrogenase-like protein (mu-crystallin family)
MLVRVINESDVNRLLPMQKCIELVRHAMILTAQGRALQPIRTGLSLPNSHGLLGMMPGYTADPEWLGIKVTSVFPNNHGTEYGSHQGMVLLFDTQVGCPVAIVNGRAVTYLRTAAASAVATGLLARTNTRSIAILGYGDQAAAHIRSLSIVRRVEQFVIWGRSIQRCKEFAARQRSIQPTQIECVADIEEALECDVICTTTAADRPLFQSSMLRDGVHLNVVGSSIPTTSEIDSESVHRSRYYVDYKDSALALAGEFLAAKRAGVVTDKHILGSIGDVLIGRVPGRQSPIDITLFKSLGMISEDLVSADYIYRCAQQENIGALVEL